ncbi:MAG: BspA family leucine-rich repeat surface protein, partial [Clostridia bacterium]
CWNITELDVSNFNMDKVEFIDGIFRRCINLEYLDLSNWNTNSLKSMTTAFKDCYKIKEIKLSNFNTSNVTEMDNAFSGCSQLEKVDLSNFDTSKVEKIEGMFQGATKLKTTITISSGNITNYSQCFENSATAEGAQITVNYKKASEGIIDKIINTKSADSNVVKGILVD